MSRWLSGKCLIILEVLCGHPPLPYLCLFQEVAFSVSCTGVAMSFSSIRAILRDITVAECMDFSLQCSGVSSCFMVFVILLQRAHYCLAVGIQSHGLKLWV